MYCSEDGYKDEYVLAISFRKENLIEITNKKEHSELFSRSDVKFIIRENMKVFNPVMIYDENGIEQYQIMYINYPGKQYNYSTLYGFRRNQKGFLNSVGLIDLYGFNHDELCEVLLFNRTNHDFRRISVNSIKFDTLYDEGIDAA